MNNNNVHVKISRRMFNDRHYDDMFDYSTRWTVYFGSAGSGKSYSLAQKLILKGLKEKRRLLVTRKYASTLRHSVFQLFKDVLTSFHLLGACKITETMLYIELPNGSEFIFMGLDEENKLLSIQDISDVWVEEATEASQDLLEQLSLRIRGKASNHQIHLSFNPVSKTNYLYNFIVLNPPSSLKVIHSTYKDNKFLPQSYIDSLEDLIRTSPRKAKVYVYGEWGVMGQLVFENNWFVDIVNVKEYLSKGYVPRFGGDFGFTLDPTSVVGTLYHQQKQEIVVFGELYQRGLTNPDLVELLKENKWDKQKFYFDSADPKSIEELRRMGIKAFSAIKGKDSIKQGVSFLERHKIIVDESCTNMINELQSYAYRKDKKTGLYYVDKYEGDDHAIDALRYAYSDVYRTGKINTIPKNRLGV
jgi:phage terminase large subunit